MIVTRDWLIENYNKYRTLIFEDKLPTIQGGPQQWVIFDLKINNSKKNLGCFVRQRNGFFGDMRFTIKVSKYYDRSEKDFIDTLVHEMIHCYIAYNDIIDNANHGNEFKRMMRLINLRYSLNINVKTKVIEKPSNPKHEEHLILTLETSNDQHFICNLNKNYAREIVDHARRYSGTSKLALFKSKDVKFESWCKVRTLRGRKLPKAAFTQIYNELRDEGDMLIEEKREGWYMIPIKQDSLVSVRS